MFLTKIQKFKFPIVLMTFWALTFGFLCMGIFHKATMNMPMVDTVAMTSQSEQVCCGSAMFQHFDTWKNILIVLPQQIRDNLALLMFGFLMALVFVWPFRYRSLDINFLLLRFYIRDNPELALFNHLKLAFARGILNPKVF